MVDVNSSALISRNESKLVEARKNLYSNSEILTEGTRNEVLLKRGQYIGKISNFLGKKTLNSTIKRVTFNESNNLGKILLPCMILSFSLIYWGYGLSFYLGEN